MECGLGVDSVPIKIDLENERFNNKFLTRKEIIRLIFMRNFEKNIKRGRG
jgi:hypothetical protein